MAQHAPQDSRTDWRPLYVVGMVRLGYLKASHARASLAQHARRDSNTGRRPPLVMESAHASEGLPFQSVHRLSMLGVSQKGL